MEVQIVALRVLQSQIIPILLQLRLYLETAPATSRPKVQGSMDGTEENIV